MVDNAYRVEAEVKENGTLTLDNLPFVAGEQVEVIVSLQAGTRAVKPAYSLRGTPYKFDRPFEGVAEDDWDATR